MVKCKPVRSALERLRVSILPLLRASQGSNLLTLEQIYSEWSTLYFRKVGRKSAKDMKTPGGRSTFGAIRNVGYQDQRLSTGYGYSAKQKPVSPEQVTAADRTALQIRRGRPPPRRDQSIALSHT